MNKMKDNQEFLCQFGPIDNSNIKVNIVKFVTAFKIKIR